MSNQLPGGISATVAKTPAGQSPASPGKQSADKTAGGGEWFYFVLLVILVGAYYQMDQQYFASRRPWNLFLFILEVAVVGVAAVCFVLVLIHLCRSSDRLLGMVAALLTPVFGLGALIAFIWGWKELAKRNDKGSTLMLCWSGSLVAQVVILLYVWSNAPPPQPVPWTISTAVHQQRGAPFQNQQDEEGRREEQRQRDLQRDLMQADRDARNKEDSIRFQQSAWEMEKRLMDSRHK